MKIKAILFDMDGVLIEAKDWHYEALNRALSLFGMPISRFDHLTTFDGLPTKKKLEFLTLERGLSPQLHGFLNELKQKYTMEIIHTHCKPFFVHEFMMSRFSAAGILTAVCSNSIRATVETMMDKAALSNYLDLMISNEDVSNGKPDPEMYLKAMDFFSLKPNECLIVEDNENGIKAAKASGGHLLVVEEIEDVNFTSISQKIKLIESGVEL